MSLFETSLQKISRLIAQQWGIDVIFEGTEAKTDGRTITLPACSELSQEIMSDLNGFLDAQVAKVKYTNFSLLNKTIQGKGKALHEQLFKAAEQVRVERSLVQQYPGCQYNLNPLHEKMASELQSSWDTLPWPVRVVHSVRSALQGKPRKPDDDTAEILSKINPLIEDLQRSRSTQSVLDITQEITRRVLEYLEEEEEENKDQRPENSSSEQDTANQSAEEQEGQSSPGNSSDLEDSSESDEDKAGEAGEAEEAASQGTSPELSEADKSMLENSQKWTDYDMSTDDFVNKEIKTEIAPGGSRPQYGKSKQQHLPATTRFDVEIDWTATGEHSGYVALKQGVQEHVAPIRRSLERALKVIENARWSQERERGLLNTRSLSRLIAEPGYRKPFKELTKTEINNVAIQILIDMSGSMGGRMETAKATAVVLAEALKELDIPFEVCGFHAQYDSKFANWSHANKADPSVFNRRTEALRKYVFKRFDSHNLTGITRLYVGSQNPDGEGVRWAAERLSRQKTKRKILFVLSDGAPAAEGDCNILAKDLKLAVDQVTKFGIEVVGIGIQTSHVKEFYPDYIVVNKVQDLPSETMHKLSKLILKGVS